MPEAETPPNPVDETEVPQALRAGSRWLHHHPSEDQVREWFASQSLHVGMDHDPYVGGIVAIGATEKYKVTKTKANGDQYVAEAERAVFTPYVKIDTRIAYFWALVRALNQGIVEAETDGLSERARTVLRAQLDGPFVGVIEAVPQRRISSPSSPFYNEHMPEGFSMHAVTNKDNSVSRYVVATFRVAIYERDSWSSKIAGRAPVPLLQGVGTKQTPLSRAWADDNALMKAETGAIGRALGVAGILVVGTGVATAEDMQEAAAGPVAAAGASAPPAELPPVVNREGQPAAVVPKADEAQADTPAPAAQGAVAPVTPQGEDEMRRTMALGLQGELEKEFPEAWEAYKAWWAERGFGPLHQLSGPALKGAVVKLERDLDSARRAGVAEPGPGEPE